MSDQLLTQILDELKGINLEQKETQNKINVINSTMATKQDLEKVTTTVEGLNDQVATNSEKLGKLGDNVATNSEKLEKLGNHVATNSEKLEGLRDHVATNSEKLERLGDQVTTNSEKLEGLRDHVATNSEKLEWLGDQVTTNSEKLERLGDQVTTNSRKLDVIQDQQQQIKQATLDTKQDVIQIQGNITSLKNGQERQDKILESLSLRSLEQETEIRTLNRIK